MSKTKEEILGFENYRHDGDSLWYKEPKTLAAMDEWGKCQAMAFVEWVFKENWTIYKHPNVWSNELEDTQVLTTAELYDLFITQTNG